MKTMKRILSIVLTAVLLCAAPISDLAGEEMPAWLDFSSKANALAATGKCGDNVTWSFNSSSGTLTISGTGEMYDYYYSDSPFYSNTEIRSIVMKSGVTSIGCSAFVWCQGLTSMTIPGNVTSIRNYAFSGCTGLKSVTIGSGVTNIGDGAFEMCISLMSVTIPDSVTSIGDCAFEWCTGLTNMTIGNSVKSIGKEAFAWCEGLTRVTIGNSVKKIGERAFDGCTSLTSITVNANNAYYCNDEYGVLFNKDKIELMRYPAGRTDKSYVIPNSVTSIGEDAFVGCTRLKSITIPDSVTSIGTIAFYNCTSLTSVTISDSVTSIGGMAFGYYYADGNIKKCNPFKIYCYKGTAGEQYAIDNGFDYELLTGKPDHSPAPSVTLSNVSSSGKIKVAWNSTGAAKYEVYRAASKSGSYKLMKTTTGTSYVNTSAVAGKTYYYKVRGVNADGTKSAFSAVKSRTCDLARPVITTSNVASSGKIKVKWDAVSGAVSYKVYRSTSKNGTYKLMKTTSSTGYTNTSVTAGTKYYYKVKAIAENSAANSAYSTVKSRTAKLARPTITVSRNYYGSITVSWNRVDGAVAYRVYRSTSANGEYTLMKTVTSGTSYTNTSAVKGTTYYYKVKAICSNADGSSAYSEVRSIRA